MEIDYSEDFEARWLALLRLLRAQFGKELHLNGILFLIGVQELGQGITEFTKEQKQDLMHIATCKLFSLSGFYKFERLDEDGWPHYQMLKPIPSANLKEQEKMLKWHILEYFDRTE
jgi:hypothetical protein